MMTWINSTLNGVFYVPELKKNLLFEGNIASSCFSAIKTKEFGFVKNSTAQRLLLSNEPIILAEFIQKQRLEFLQAFKKYVQVVENKFDSNVNISMKNVKTIQLRKKQSWNTLLRTNSSKMVRAKGHVERLWKLRKSSLTTVD